MNDRASIALDAMLVIAIGLLVNCMRIGSGPLAGTEGNRALTALQMAHTGQWLIPKLYDQVYLAKPPLDYWILVGIQKLTGEANELIWRLPSAVAGALMAGFLCVMTRRWFGRLAGLFSGIGACSLVALWGQNHTAEIDAMLSLFTVVSACLLIELCVAASWRGRAACAAAAGLAMGAALLLKGPAGMTAIAGAVAGPAIFNRTWATLKQPWIWIALALGLAIFAAYALAALWEFHQLHLRLETSGVREIGTNLFLNHPIKNRLMALLLPVELLVYAIPMSFFAPMALRKPIWSGNGDVQGRSGIWSDRDRYIVRALVGSMAVACVLTIVCAMRYPRYSYVWLPLICPVAGAVAAAWQRGFYGKIASNILYIGLGGAEIGFTIGLIIMAVVCTREQAGHAQQLWGSVAIAALMAAIIVPLIRFDHFALAAVGVVLIMFLTANSFGIVQAEDRQLRSGQQCAQVIARIVPPGQTIVTGHIVLDQPEIFYYAGLNVESYAHDPACPRRFATSRWVLLRPDEYSAWSRALDRTYGRLKPVVRIEGHHFLSILARYELSGDGGALAIKESEPSARQRLP